jgi:transposase-like protein
MRSGRLPKLTPEIRKKVCEAIVGGNTRDDAARYAGINPATFYRWMKRGRQAGRGAMCDFCKAVKKAENDCVVRNVAIIGKAAQKTWTAAAWWLGRARTRRR